jgi:hypothetical protein
MSEGVGKRSGRWGEKGAYFGNRHMRKKKKNSFDGYDTKSTNFIMNKVIDKKIYSLPTLLRRSHIVILALFCKCKK